MPLYAASIFLGAFLLFQVQPLLGRFILPWFGGTPAVWMTCMLFFQSMLLAGYLYAHLITSRLCVRRQVAIHGVLVAAALVLLPIAPDAARWKPEPDASPVASILLLLLCNAGLPGMLVAATSPLLQRWFAERFPEASPYRLYALSNVGSVLALVSYPFVFEPVMKLGAQSWMWSAAFGAYGVITVVCGLMLVKTVPHGTACATEAKEASEPVAGGWIALWMLLSACGSAHLLAATNQLCQEVASFPFLWVLPLTLYLITFIICFDRERWYHRGVTAALLVVAVVVACRLLYRHVNAGFVEQVAGYGVVLFAICMACHGELVRLRPPTAHLTLFYLVIAAGGVLGGIFVALVAPVAFSGYYEYQLSIAASIGLVLVAWRCDATFRERMPKMVWAASGPGWLVLLLAMFYLAGLWELQPALAARLGVTPMLERHDLSTRNFYGVLTVTDRSEGEWAYRRLQHGRTVHGFQFLDPAKQDWPTAYFGPGTGVSATLVRHPNRLAAVQDGTLLLENYEGMNVGVVGLGVGTLLAWGLPGDVFRIYEINPEVFELADKYFTFTSRTHAEYQRVLGDGRIELERELEEGGSHQYDVLVIDAFSSDAIPVHLLTLECARVYAAHVKTDGLLAFNISNRHVDLVPVVAAIANELGMKKRLFRTPHNEWGSNDAEWMVLTNNEAWLEDSEVLAIQTAWSTGEGSARAWTDDFSSLWPVLKK